MWEIKELHKGKDKVVSVGRLKQLLKFLVSSFEYELI